MISVFSRNGEKPHDILHVVSCYAPTWGSSRAIKDEFWNGLESFLAAVPPKTSESSLETLTPGLAQGFSWQPVGCGKGSLWFW